MICFSLNGLTTKDGKIQVDLLGLDPATGAPNNQDFLKKMYDLPQNIQKATNIYRRKDRKIVIEGIDNNGNLALVQCSLDTAKGFNCQDGNINPISSMGAVSLDFDDNLLVVDKTFKSGYIYALGAVAPTSKSFYRWAAAVSFDEEFSKALSSSHIWHSELSREGVMIRLVDDNGKHLLDHVNFIVRENTVIMDNGVNGFSTGPDFYLSLTNTDIFRMNNHQGFYSKNIESYIEISPKDLKSTTFKIQATEGKTTAELDLDYTAIQDFDSATPQIPEMPDLYASTGRDFIYLLKRNNFNGNNLAFDFEATLKHKGIYATSYKFTLSYNMSILRKVQGYSFSNDYLAVWSQETNKAKEVENHLDIFFCTVIPGVTITTCQFVANETLAEGDSLDMKGLNVNYTNPVFLVKNDKSGFVLKTLKLNKKTNNVSIQDLAISVHHCDDFMIQISVQANNLFLCIQNSMIRVFNLTIKGDVRKSSELASITNDSVNKKNFCPQNLRLSEKNPRVFHTYSNCPGIDSRIYEFTLSDDINYNVYFDVSGSLFLAKKANGELGYDFCPFKEEILIFDFDNQILTSYDSEISTVKSYSADELNFANVEKIYCSNLHSTLALYGSTKAKKSTFHDVVFLRANNIGRNYESRRIVHSTSSLIGGMNAPYIYSFGGSLAMTYNFGSQHLYLNEVIFVNEYALLLNTVGEAKSGEAKSYTLTATSRKGEKASNGGLIYIEDVPFDVSVEKHSDSKLRTNTGLYYLDNILQIKGPTLYVNLSRKSNHIKMAKTLSDSTKDFLPYNLMKTSRDLAAGGIRGIPYFVIYHNYREIMKSPEVDKNSNGIIDLEILYFDDGRTQVVSSILHTIGFFNCSISFYSSNNDFLDPQTINLSQDGGCYNKMTLKRFRGSNFTIGFFKKDFGGKLDVFKFQDKEGVWELVQARPVVIDKVDQFSVLADSDEKNFTLVYTHGVTLSTASFAYGELDTPVFKTLKPKIKFLARDIKCAEMKIHCVADASGNRLFHFWPLNTTEKSEIEVKLLNKFDGFYGSIMPTTLAINSEFVAYYSFKIPDSKSKNIKVAVQLFDVSNQTLEEYNITHLALINNFTQNSSAQAQAIPFGFVSLSDIKGYVGLGDDFKSSPKSFLGYQEGGASWHKLRKNLFLNFTEGYYRDDQDIQIDVVGLDDEGNQKVVKIELGDVFDLKKYSLRWYYWMVIIVGGILILSVVLFLLLGKMESDQVLDEDAFKKVNLNSALHSTDEDVIGSLVRSSNNPASEDNL